MASVKTFDSSPVSPEHETPPQRLSAMYQYHNAPEVLPAHGLEYDDGSRTHSDKCLAGRGSSYMGYQSDKRHEHYSHPPRIIFGMKLRTFFLVAILMIAIIVGAAVGGAVGGKSLSDKGVTSPASSSDSSSPTSSSSSANLTSPTTDCPSSDNSTYTFTSFQQSASNVPSNAGLSFIKHCDIGSPLSQTGAHKITQAYVYTFDDCIDICAAYNFWNGGSNCSVAVYEADSSRPGNCWIGHIDKIDPNALSTLQGTDVALLNT